jgi:L-ascorbate metabolism protein UlaG (beta-lactamase superfamily)
MLHSRARDFDALRAHTVRTTTADRTGGGISITWMGTAGFFITDGASSFYIDPYVSRHPLRKIALGSPLRSRTDLVECWMGRTGGRSADAVLVSHTHFDHVLDAPSFAARTGAVLCGSESTAWVARSAGLPPDRVKTIGGTESLTFGKFRIKVIESVHGPALLGRIPYPGAITGPVALPAPASAYRLGGVFTFLIEHPHGSILHHGSAGCVPGMYRDIRANLLLLGIGGRGDTRAYLEETALRIHPHALVPVHFDCFFKPLDAPLAFLPRVRFAEFVREAGDAGFSANLKVLPVGEAVRLDEVAG